MVHRLEYLLPDHIFALFNKASVILLYHLNDRRCHNRVTSCFCAFNDFVTVSAY